MVANRADPVPFVLPESANPVEQHAVLWVGLSDQRCDVIGRATKIPFWRRRHPTRMAPLRAHAPFLEPPAIIVVDQAAALYPCPQAGGLLQKIIRPWRLVDDLECVLHNRGALGLCGIGPWRADACDPTNARAEGLQRDQGEGGACRLGGRKSPRGLCQPGSIARPVDLAVVIAIPAVRGAEIAENRDQPGQTVGLGEVEDDRGVVVAVLADAVDLSIVAALEQSPAIPANLTPPANHARSPRQAR